MKKCQAIYILLICSIVASHNGHLAKIMGHRGLWGYLPEHAIRGHEFAYFMGADYLETDVNLTKDNQLIVFHDAYLDDVTDVNTYPEYESRRKSDIVDGLPVLNKLFTSDFTYAEIQRLFLKQRNPMRPQIYNREFKVILIEDLIKMTIEMNKKYNKHTGIYIEPKSVDYYLKVKSVNVNQLLVELLSKYDLLDQTQPGYHQCPIVIQSFELETLIYFKKYANLPQIALMRWRQFYDMKQLAQLSDGFGPDVDFLLYERVDDLLYVNGTVYDNAKSFQDNVLNTKFLEPIEKLGKRILASKENAFVRYAESLKKEVHPWNLNNDDPKFSYDPSIEFAKLTQLGVKAFFSDFCDTALFATKHFESLLKNVSEK